MNIKLPSKSNYGAEGDRFYASCQTRIEKVRLLRNKIVNAEGEPSEERVLPLLAEIDILMDAGLCLSDLLESVHHDERVRKAAEVSHQEMAKLSSELDLDRELYEAVVAVEPLVASRDAQMKRYVKHTLRDFRRSGVNKDKATRERIKALDEALVSLGQEFGRNIRKDTRSILLESPDELAGLPPDYIEAHKPGEDGKIGITTDYPDLVPFMSYARSGTRRKELHREYMNRAWPENLEVLSKILKARHEMAGLVDHRSWASFVTQDKMIRTADAIARFIEDIMSITKERSDRDYSVLLERKRRDDPGAESVEEWEKAYLSELVRTETLGFNSQEIRPYLEYGRVKEGVLSVTQKLFGLEYRKIDDLDKPTWHESVETYDVFEHDEHIGRFHLDMHPRKGKYKHAAMFPIVSGVAGLQLPEAALVCNFPSPSARSGSALLEHSDVVTFFHEFGHLLHHILGGAQLYTRFSGVATEWDFVEVPSQLLEEWAFSYQVLREFTAHVETGEPIPEEMVERMNLARGFGRGARVCGQMFYAALSLAYHDRSPEGMDTTALLKEIQNRYSPYRHVEGTHLQASFGHLEGYSALYYTYMWSLVIVRDLFDQFIGSEMFDTELAVRYRQKILEPGGSSDAVELIRDFLGRDYNLDAFKRWVECS